MRWNSIVWKLNAVFIAILVTVIATFSYVESYAEFRVHAEAIRRSTR